MVYKAREVSSQFWKVKVTAQQQLDNGEDFMSSLRQGSAGEERSHAEIGGQRARAPGERTDFFSTLSYLQLGSIPQRSHRLSALPPWVLTHKPWGTHLSHIQSPVSVKGFKLALTS